MVFTLLIRFCPFESELSQSREISFRVRVFPLLNKDSRRAVGTVENSAQLFFAEFSKRGGNGGRTCLSFFHGFHRAAVSIAHPRSSRRGLSQLGLGSPAPGTTLEQVSMVKEAIKHSAHSGGISQQLAPVIDRSV